MIRLTARTRLDICNAVDRAAVFYASEATSNKGYAVYRLEAMFGSGKKRIVTEFATIKHHIAAVMTMERLRKEGTAEERVSCAKAIEIRARYEKRGIERKKAIVAARLRGEKHPELTRVWRAA